MLQLKPQTVQEMRLCSHMLARICSRTTALVGLAFNAVELAYAPPLSRLFPACVWPYPTLADTLTPPLHPPPHHVPTLSHASSLPVAHMCMRGHRHARRPHRRQSPNVSRPEACRQSACAAVSPEGQRREQFATQVIAQAAGTHKK